MTLLDMATALARRQIRFVIVGGLAARAHGSHRITEDLDICYDDATGNVRLLAAMLAEWNAYLRGVEPGLPFIMDERTFRTTPVLTLLTDHGAIDLMDVVAGVGRYADAVRSSVVVPYDGVPLRFLDLPALIAAKRAAARPKDREQLPELTALLALRTKGRAKKR